MSRCSVIPHEWRKVARTEEWRILVRVLRERVRGQKEVAKGNSLGTNSL